MRSIKNIPAVLMIICFWFFPSKAQSAKWEYLAYSGAEDNGNISVYYIDTSSINDTSKYIYSFWIRIDHSRNVTVKQNFEMQKYELDCDKSEMRLRSYYEYNADGSPIKSKSWSDYESNWVAVVPDSIGDAAIKRICN